VTGEWAPWLDFFLKGVEGQARDALVRSRRVRELREEYRDLLQSKKESANAFRLLDSLFENPYTTAPRAAELLNVTHAGAQGILARLVSAAVLSPLSGTWPRLFVARGVLESIEGPV
jgi:Fic family protein